MIEFTDAEIERSLQEVLSAELPRREDFVAVDADERYFCDESFTAGLECDLVAVVAGPVRIAGELRMPFLLCGPCFERRYPATDQR